MHIYASDNRSRQFVYLYLAICAILCAWLLQKSIQATGRVIPWWIETPSVMGFYGLLWKWFDRSLWKTSLAHRLRLVSVPNLGGQWTAHAEYVLDGTPGETAGTARIKQTWTRMSIAIDWERSRSYSIAAIVQPSPAQRIEVIYQYVNEPDVGAVDTMNIHRGTGWLTHDPESGVLAGEYFSGRGRQQFGKLTLSRVT